MADPFDGLPEGVFGGFAGWLQFLEEKVEPAAIDGGLTIYRASIEPDAVEEAMADSLYQLDFGNASIPVEFSVDENGALRLLRVQYGRGTGAAEVDLALEVVDDPADVEGPLAHEVWPGPESCGQ